MHDSTLQPILAVLGYPVAGNPMQFVGERLLADACLDWKVISMNVAPDRLEEALRGADAMGFSALAIAEPHRETAASYYEQTGAIDFVIRHDDDHLQPLNIFGQQLAELLVSRVKPDAALAVFGRHPDAVALAHAMAAEGRPIRLVDYDEGDDSPAVATAGPTEELEEARGILVGDGAAPPNCSIVADVRHHEAPQAASITRLDLTVRYLETALQTWTQQQFDTDLIRDLVEEYWAI